jgi:oxygen-independent coproporphyrinogen-3 oxidase
MKYLILPCQEYHSKHNSNYWKKQPYLGIGPSAHSYNGITRQCNVANNVKYIKALDNNTIPATVEVLSVSDQINEYVLTSLRTKWGCDFETNQLSIWNKFAGKKCKIYRKLPAPKPDYPRRRCAEIDSGRKTAG